jgi:DNA-binding GntR family transcriptional regulator
MAARLCAESGDASIVKSLELSLAAIRRSYSDKDAIGVLSNTTAFYQTLFGKVDRHVASGVVNLLTVRMNHLRSWRAEFARN